MKLKSRIRTASFFAMLVALPVAGRADLGEDTHIQESGEVRIDIDRQAFDELQRLFNLGYPPATVMMHAITTGMSLNDILFIAVKSDVSRAQEFYDTAESLLPALPGWVCQAEVDQDRYVRSVNLSDLGQNPTIRQVAGLFFNDDRRLVPFPNWSEGKIHMSASVDELASLVSDEDWYIPGADDGTPRTAPNRPIFVSLYKDSGEIVVDSGADRIRRAREQGIGRLPVVLVYNNVKQRPISSFGQDVTLGDLAQDFYSEGIELTAVPEWRAGDYHKLATPEELSQVVEIPTRDDIPPEQWGAVEQELRSNNLQLSRPLLLTLVRSGPGRAWVNEPTTVAVASSLGMTELPVVLFYHDIDRTPCGQPARCEDSLCEAATAAGASQDVCSSSGEQGTTAGASTVDDGKLLELTIDPHLYDGLSYTQNQCTS